MFTCARKEGTILQQSGCRYGRWRVSQENTNLSASTPRNSAAKTSSCDTAVRRDNPRQPADLLLAFWVGVPES